MAICREGFSSAYWPGSLQGASLMSTRATPPYRYQRDLFEKDGRLPMVDCPVCKGRKTVPFWSRQGKVPVIGGKQVRCETCKGTGQAPAP